mmetsp:Transcript_29360/g.84344  ORF Transcript_29360/g.84344 Transcript_29360/m.84344 type:complete len:340 (-) Transcript_29360:184-1203(-)
MMEVMEEHLVEAVPATEDKRHDGVEDRPLALGVLGKEAVPPVRVVEVGEDNPGDGEARASRQRDGQQEAPALAQRAAQRVGAEEPDAAPEGREESLVLESVREPLLEKVLVALPAAAGIREVEPPEHGEQGSCVVGADEMPDGHQRNSQPAVPLVRPLLEVIEPGGRVPAKLAVDQEVHGARVVPVVLEDDLGPRQRDQIRERVGDVVLPLVGRERGAVDDIVQDVHILDHEHGEWQGKEEGGEVPVQTCRQHRAVRKDARALAHEDQRVDVPHVHHLLHRDLCEEERELCRHGVGLVGLREGPLALLALAIRPYRGGLVPLHHLLLGLVVVRQPRLER